MDTPRDCKHGNLSRSCEVCTIERELAKANARIAELTDKDLCKMGQSPCQYALTLIARAESAERELATLRQVKAGQQAEPGWVLVPKEPTEEMLLAGHNAGSLGGEQGDEWEWPSPYDAYTAMLAAAPAAPESKK